MFLILLLDFNGLNTQQNCGSCSPKLAACAVDVSSSYPETALSLETVCHLIASALASWPTHAWAPGLFHTLLDSVQAASSLALGPKETCSMLCLLVCKFVYPA